MYSYEERIKAVRLLIQYDMRSADVRRELGYPSKEALRSWYAEKRIKMSLGGMSPLNYRKSLGLMI